MDLKNKADSDWLKKEHKSVFAKKEKYRWSHFKHLEGGEMLKLMINTNITHVAYKGTSPSLTALAGRSITSPAAILPVVSGESFLIFDKPALPL